MRAYSSTQPLYNLLTPPINSRYAVHLAAISESSGNPYGDGFHTLNSPIYPDSGCYLFSSCLGCPLRSCKDDLRPKDLRHLLLKLHHPSVIPGTEA